MCLCKSIILADGGSGPVQPKTHYRLDYKPPAYVVDHADLTYELDFVKTRVLNVMKIVRKRDEDLVLDGEDIELISIRLNGNTLASDSYTINSADNSLTIPAASLSPPFCLEIENYCFPEANTHLSGLYKSKNLVCTQCESQGFRRMTYFIDRPDNMSSFRTTLVGDKTVFPTMLSNGNVIDTAELDNNRHMITYDDPHPKPCYLFAIICGTLESIAGQYRYVGGPADGKVVDIFVYGEAKYMKQLEWSLECVKKSMEWDYIVMHRAYDLDRFGVVCIEDFNAGAMENKGLTTYNVSCILAHKDTSSDARFQRVSSVIGHEYFHNWSGNRVTVRDWFQITLKEGFTNLREQLFDEWCYSESVQRIHQVSDVRTYQFPEDSGPFAHPIRPDSYQSVDNFYTMTVYEKGAEVIRMMRTIVGNEKFVEGTDLYFAKHDGKAVSCLEFREAISEASNVDLSQFEAWYSQKGTPVVQVLKRQYCPANKTYTLRFKQIIPDQGEGKPKLNYIIPITTGLIGLTSGRDLIGSTVLVMTEEEQEFVIKDVTEDCVPSLFRKWSAPVMVENFLKNEELAVLLAHDTDEFQRWECAQVLLRQECIARAESGNYDQPLASTTADALNRLARGTSYEFIALAMCSPVASSLECYMRPADPVALAKAVRSVTKAVAQATAPIMVKYFENLCAESAVAEWSVDAASCARRALQNKALALISIIDEQAVNVQPTVNRVLNYFNRAENFNDKNAAFMIALQWPISMPERQIIIDTMYNICKDDPVMLDGWFAAQLSVSKEETIEVFKRVIVHPDYAGTHNPNRFRAVVGTFARNLCAFHGNGTEAYDLVKNEILAFDKLNPYTAANVTKILCTFKNYIPLIQERLTSVVNGMLEAGGLSPNVTEIINLSMK